MGESDDSPLEVLRATVKKGVTAANSGLAAMQSKVESTLQPVAPVVASFPRNAAAVYQRRQEFALPAIGGSAVLGGGFAALRRGRIAGAVSAAASGGFAYAVVYGHIDYYVARIPEFILGKRE